MLVTTLYRAMMRLSWVKLEVRPSVPSENIVICGLWVCKSPKLPQELIVHNAKLYCILR